MKNVANNDKKVNCSRDLLLEIVSRSDNVYMGAYLTSDYCEMDVCSSATVAFDRTEYEVYKMTVFYKKFKDHLDVATIKKDRYQLEQEHMKHITRLKAHCLNHRPYIPPVTKSHRYLLVKNIYLSLDALDKGNF